MFILATRSESIPNNPEKILSTKSKGLGFFTRVRVSFRAWDLGCRIYGSGCGDAVVNDYGFSRTGCSSALRAFFERFDEGFSVISGLSIRALRDYKDFT